MPALIELDQHLRGTSKGQRGGARKVDSNLQGEGGAANADNVVARRNTRARDSHVRVDIGVRSRQSHRGGRTRGRTGSSGGHRRSRDKANDAHDFGRSSRSRTANRHSGVTRRGGARVLEQTHVLTTAH